MIVGLLLFVSGCQQKMAEQPRVSPRESSRDYVTRGENRQPDQTVARGQLQQDLHYFTGRKSAKPTEANELGAAVELSGFVDEFPYAPTADVMARGQERFAIYCAPCHAANGYGKGRIVRAGFPEARSFHDERLRSAPAGYLFHIIQHGYQKMPPFAGMIDVHDSWAIVAYVRALQLSQHAELATLPDDVRTKFE
jgi:mono/diheme cytochrome c family protein